MRPGAAPLYDDKPRRHAGRRASTIVERRHRAKSVIMLLFTERPRVAGQPVMTEQSIIEANGNHPCSRIQSVPLNLLPRRDDIRCSLVC